RSGDHASARARRAPSLSARSPADRRARRGEAQHGRVASPGSRSMRALALISVLLAGCSAKGELWIGGDVHLGTRAKIGRLDAIGALFPGAIGVVNLEGPIGDFDVEGKLVNARASIAELSRAGVRVAGVANNHRGDLGDDGERATKSALGDAGILPAF